MTDNSNDALTTLRSALDSAHQLEATLESAGLQLPPDISDIIVNVRQALITGRQQTENIVRQLEMLQNLIRRSALITTSLQLDQVLEQVMDSVISLTGAERAYLMLQDKESGDMTVRAARNWDHQTLPDHEVAVSRSVIATALEKMEPIMTTNAQDDVRFQNALSVMRGGLRSILCVPLLLDDQIIGVLYTDNSIQKGLFHQGIIPLLSAFGTQAAIAIEKARLHYEELLQQRLAEELSVGRRIQLGLLPKSCPIVAGWDFAATYEPARVVSGDFYDFFTLPVGENYIGIVIADVADKGVPAAIFMALSRTMIRTTALSGLSPAAALVRANTLILKDSQSDLFLTAFYTALDTSTGQIIFANGGHNHPLLLRSTGELSELTARGIILGMYDDITLDDGEDMLNPGDVVVFYTDGVTEAMNPDDELFGTARLKATLIAAQESSAGEIVNAILLAVREFTAGAPPSDDLTIVVVKRAPSA